MAARGGTENLFVFRLPLKIPDAYSAMRDISQ